jgi:hypothetical protein
MLKTFALTAAAGMMSVLLMADVNALPLAQGKIAIEQSSDVTVVRDGCGRGMRYSRSRGRCVLERDADPVRPIVRELLRPGRDAMPGCGRGFRWSERARRCVRI